MHVDMKKKSLLQLDYGYFEITLSGELLAVFDCFACLPDL